MTEKIVVEITPTESRYCVGCQMLTIQYGILHGDRHERFVCLAGFLLPLVPIQSRAERPQECRDNAETLAGTEWNLLWPKQENSHG